MFRTVPLSIIRRFSLYTQQWHMSYRFSTCFGLFFFPSSGVFTVHTVMVYVIQVCYMFRTVPLSIIRSFSLYPRQYYMSYRFAYIFRAGTGRNLYDIYHSCVYSEKLLIMDRGTVRNMQSFSPKINQGNQCIQLVLLQDVNFVTLCWQHLQQLHCQLSSVQIQLQNFWMQLERPIPNNALNHIEPNCA